MALTKQRRPLSLMAGTVIAVEAKAEYDNNSNKPTGNVGRYDVTILQSNHATPDVRFPVAIDSPNVPNVGDRVALVVEAGETREYGANFRVVRHATDDDVEEFARFLPALAGK
jgi:hypothetical protein